MNQKKNSPSHNVFLLPDEQDQRDGLWPFVGAAWKNKDGSFNVALSENVLKGRRLQLRKRKTAFRT